MTIEAKVVADSSFGSTRLITLEIEIPRFILSQFNTHRAMSRNFQSSRAVPVEKMIEQVWNNPAIPVRFGANKPGMQDDGVALISTVGIEMENGDIAEVSPKTAWCYAAKKAVESAKSFSDAGYHKQIVNRILEPFMCTRGVTTATLDAWQSFLKLRNHKDAQPEIKALAVEIEKAIDESIPLELDDGDWHLPYFRGHGVDGLWSSYYNETLENAIKISASCCAQVSYRTLDDSLEKAKKIYDMLNLPVNGVYPEDPPHFSPTEHIAKAGDCDFELSGNFQCTEFTQYRKVLEKGLELQFIK